MTSLSDPMLIQCPKCLGYLQKREFASGGGRESFIWSDGYASGSVSSMFQPLVRCPLCREVHWGQDAKVLGLLLQKPRPMSRLGIFYAKLTGDKNGLLAEQERWNNTKDELKNPPGGMSTEFSDLLMALNAREGLTTAREALLRRKIWWANNTYQRLQVDGTPILPAPLLTEVEAKLNMLELLKLHDDGDIDAPMEKAEILRQFGRFEEAIEALNIAKEYEKHSQLWAKIMQLSESMDVSVHEVWRCNLFVKKDIAVGEACSIESS
jgi:hypothetical protein